MRDKIVESFIVCLSAFVIIKGDWVYEKMFPQCFWKQKIAMLEKRERADLWRVHREEWRFKRAELDLSFALTVAADEAECLAIDSKVCIKKAKEPFPTKMEEIQQSLKVAKSVHQQTVERLKAARTNLSG